MDDIESIKSRYLAGETTSSIAKDYNINYGVIGLALNRHGVKLRKTGSKKYKETISNWELGIK